MTLYDDLAAIIKGNRGDRLDMMIPLGAAALSTLANAKIGWIEVASITMFLGVFGLVYAVWRIIAICVKKITGEWYRDRFLAILRSESQAKRRAEIRDLRETLLKKGKSERRILGVTRALLAEEKIWHAGGGPASGDWSTIHDPPGSSEAKEFLSRLQIPKPKKSSSESDTTIGCAVTPPSETRRP